MSKWVERKPPEVQEFKGLGYAGPTDGASLPGRKLGASLPTCTVLVPTFCTNPAAVNWSRAGFLAMAIFGEGAAPLGRGRYSLHPSADCDVIGVPPCTLSL